MSVSLIKPKVFLHDQFLSTPDRRAKTKKPHVQFTGEEVRDPNERLCSLQVAQSAMISAREVGIVAP